MGNGQEVVNIRELMEYMTAEADRGEILKDPLIQNFLPKIKLLAESTTVVRLFDFKERVIDGVKKVVHDESTWDFLDDYKDLSLELIRRVFIHSNHQQRCENYVQMMTFLAQTNVDEVRRTQRAIIVSSIVCPFNSWALKKVQAKQKKENVERAQKGEKELPIPKRLQGSEKVTLYFEYLKTFFGDVDKARRALNEIDRSNGVEAGSSLKQIVERLSSQSSKVSEADRRKAVDEFKTALGEEWTVYKDELPKGFEKTALLGNKALL